MKRKSPWSIKGIDAQSRELAKQAAAREGLTLGQWLSRQIADAHANDVAVQPPTAASEPPAAAAGTDSVASANDDTAVNFSDIDAASEHLNNELDGIASQLERAEAHGEGSLAQAAPVNEVDGEGAVTPVVLAAELPAAAAADAPRGDSSHTSAQASAARPLNVEGLLGRIESTERRIDAQMSGMTQRIESMQQIDDGGSAELRPQVEKLAGAVNSMVDHIALTDRRNSQLLMSMQDRLSEVSKSVASMPMSEALRAETTEAVQQITEQLDRAMDNLSQIEAQAQEVQAVSHCANSAAEEALAKSKHLEQQVQLSDGVISGNISELERKLSQLESRIGAMQSINSEEVGKLVGSHPVVQALDQRLLDLGNRLSQRLEVLPGSIAELEDKVDRVERGNAAIDRASIERRIGALASLIDEHSQVSDERADDAAAKIDHIERELVSIRQEGVTNAAGVGHNSVLHQEMDELRAQLDALREYHEQVDAEAVLDQLGKLQSDVQYYGERIYQIDQADGGASNADLSGIADRVDLAENNVNEIMAAWDEMAERLTEMEQQFNDTLDSVSQRVHHEEFEQVLTRLNNIDEQIKSGAIQGGQDLALNAESIRESIDEKAQQEDVDHLQEQVDSLSSLVDSIDRRVGMVGSAVESEETLEDRLDTLTERIEQVAQETQSLGEVESLKQRVDATISALDNLADQPDSVVFFAHQMKDLSGRVKAAEARYANVESLEQTVGQLFDHITDVRQHASLSAERASDRAVAKIVSQISSADGEGTQLQINAPATAEIAQMLTESEQRSISAVERVHEVAAEALEKSSGSDQVIAEMRETLKLLSDRLQETHDRTEALERVAVARGAAEIERYHAGVKIGADKAGVEASAAQAVQADASAESGKQGSQSTLDGEQSGIRDKLGDGVVAVKKHVVQSARIRRRTAKNLIADNDEGWRRGAGAAAAMALVAVGIAWQAGAFAPALDDSTVAGLDVVTEVEARNPVPLVASVDLPDWNGSAARDVGEGGSVVGLEAANEGIPFETAAISPVVNIDNALVESDSRDTPSSLSVAGSDSLSAIRSLVADMPAVGSGPLGMRIAATLGDADAQYEVGLAYISGEGVPADIPTGIAWLERAAAAGHAPATFRMALLYNSADGVEHDLARSLQLNLRAAQAGNVRAMHNYAVMQASGSAGARNLAEASRWFERAANHGLKVSQYNLGVLYDRGVGVRRDAGEAWKWYRLAAQQGDEEAATRARAVRARISDAEAEIIEQEIAAFRPKPALAISNEARVPPQGWENFSATEGGASLSRSQLIRQAQSALKRLGYNPGAVDGTLGQRTTAAIEAFSQDINIGNNAAVTPALVSLLNEAVLRAGS